MAMELAETAQRLSIITTYLADGSCFSDL